MAGRISDSGFLPKEEKVDLLYLGPENFESTLTMVLRYSPSYK